MNIYCIIPKCSDIIVVDVYPQEVKADKLITDCLITED